MSTSTPTVEDEWIFTMVLPHPVPTVMSTTAMDPLRSEPSHGCESFPSQPSSSSSSSTQQQQQRRVFELRHSQPACWDRDYNHNHHHRQGAECMPLTTTIGGTPTTTSTPMPEDEIRRAERVALLPPAVVASTMTTAITNAPARTDDSEPISGDNPSYAAVSAAAAAALASLGTTTTAETTTTTTAATASTTAAPIHTTRTHFVSLGDTHHHPTGWTFQSPYWSLQSQTLLSITYCPAWQVLPEYTATSHATTTATTTGAGGGIDNITLRGTQDTTSDEYNAVKFDDDDDDNNNNINISNNNDDNEDDDNNDDDPYCGGSWCGGCHSSLLSFCSVCCCGGKGGKKPDYITETYTIHDVMAVRNIPALHITGMGMVPALQFQLPSPWSRDRVDKDSNPTTSRAKKMTTTTTTVGTTNIMTSKMTHKKNIKSRTNSHNNNNNNNKKTKKKNSDETFRDAESILDSQDGTAKQTGPPLIPPIPDYLQDSWHQHYQRMSKRQASSTTTERIRHCPESAKQWNREGVILTIALPQSQTDAPLLWKVEIVPPPPVDATAIESTDGLSSSPVSIETITVLDGMLQTHEMEEGTHIYIHGWQSWSFTGSAPKGQAQPQSAMHNVFARAFNHGGSPPPPPPHSLSSQSRPWTDRNRTFQYCSDFFTCITSDGTVRVKHSQPEKKHEQQEDMTYRQLDETGGPAMVLGWLSQKQQFGVIQADSSLTRYQMHCSADGQVLCPGGESIITDWAYLQLTTPHSYDEEPLVHFLHDTARHNHARPLQNGPLLTGWCSWYVFYEKISAGILRENFQKLKGLRTHVPTNVAVVDDGYMTAWGDWDSLKPGKFDGGLETVARDIVASGMRPGLWLAPFAADKHSRIAKRHPNWIIRNHVGAAANSSNCGKFFYGLDATNPRVRRHAYRAIQRAVQEWKYTVLKIDFLYAACLEGNGKYDLSLSRAQAMHLALETIREAAGPDVYLIGCGCPIASGIGFVDAMRVSADTGPSWYPSFPLPWWDNGTLPSLRGMIRNSINRAPLGHRWWHNDPDCLMLGNHTYLTDDEVASAASVVAMTCGMLLLSDDLPKVPAKRVNIVSKIFPLTGVPAVVLDLHSTTDGLPSLMRLWCTDRYDFLDEFRTSRDSMSIGSISFDDEFDHNAEATFFGRRASFKHDEENWSAFERQRSCIHVTKGLGTWTIVSISNWSDKSTVLHVPPPALVPLTADTTAKADPDDRSDVGSVSSGLQEVGFHGYHVLAFWSSKYSWLPQDCQKVGCIQTISRKLNAHETEIFHVKAVTPETPQYIGSDLHFSCGKEVRSFRVLSNNIVLISLDTTYHRMGHIFVYIPQVRTDGVKATVGGVPGRCDAVGNTPRVDDNGSPRLCGRVVRVPVLLYADGRPLDGEIKIEY